MMQPKSLGQVAFEAGALASAPLIPRDRDAWLKLAEWERSYWDAIAAAVAAEAAARLRAADARDKGA